MVWPKLGMELQVSLIEGLSLSSDVFLSCSFSLITTTNPALDNTNPSRRNSPKPITLSTLTGLSFTFDDLPANLLCLAVAVKYDH